MLIHVHSKELWKKLLHRVPTSSDLVEYGTPEMAEEIFRLMKHAELPKVKILVMAGHEEGIIAFGHTVAEAEQVLISRL